MKILYALLVVLLFVTSPEQVFAQLYNGAATGIIKPPQSVYASRPSSPVTGQVWIMTDTDCAGTSSATPTQCRWSGSAWQATGGTGGGGSGITALTGDVTASGTGSVAATVVKINGVTVTGTPTSGQVPTATSGTAASWQTPGAGPGVTTNALQTLANLVTRTSSTVLTTLPYATAGTPYNFGQTGAVYSFVTSPTATITGGSGSDTAYVYVDSGGTLTVGKSNLTISCSGACTVVSGISSFPEGSIPLFTCTASSATWDVGGCTNKLQVAGATRIVAGANCTVSGGAGSPYSITCAGGGGGGMTCDTGTIAETALTNASTSQEITILTSVPGRTNYGDTILSETTQFSGGSATALTVSMGRTGTNSEMSGGVLFPLKQSSGDVNFIAFKPFTPALSTYDVVLNFVATGDNVNAFTAGSLTWTVCHNAM